MDNLDSLWTDLQTMINNGLTYKPMTDEEYQISCVNDISEWAFGIAGQWDGDNSGREEDRALQAEEIMEKCQELKDLIKGMEEL